MADILEQLNNDNLYFRKRGNVYEVNHMTKKRGLQKLSFRTPKVKVPFGPELFNKKLYLNVEFTNYEANNNVYNFMAIIKSIDNYFRDLAEICDKNVSDLEYYSNIKERPDGYDPLLRTNIKKKGRNILTKVLSSNGDSISTIYSIEKNSYISLDLELDSVWIYNDSYGINWNILNIFN